MASDMDVRQRCGTAEVWGTVEGREKLMAGFFLKLDRRCWSAVSVLIYSLKVCVIAGSVGTNGI